MRGVTSCERRNRARRDAKCERKYLLSRFFIFRLFPPFSAFLPPPGGHKGIERRPSRDDGQCGNLRAGSVLFFLQASYCFLLRASTAAAASSAAAATLGGSLAPRPAA